jgi:GMP synthase (glutamine-hydrolysing)
MPATHAGIEIAHSPGIGTISTMAGHQALNRVRDIVKKEQLKILLLQIRDQQRVREEEFASFVAYSGLAPEQIDILNVFDTPHFSNEALANYDSVFVGGASEASVLEPDRYPFVESSIRLLQHCLAIDMPVFASCFGFQLAVLALGGEIVRDTADFEMGTIPIRLTKLAAGDVLFHDTPDGFPAVSVHKERAAALPANCELLAYTESCAHAFRVKGKSFWAFQFHPEVDRATLVERLTIYKAHYTDGDEHLDAILAAAVETPESNALVRKFTERVLVGSGRA